MGERRGSSGFIGIDSPLGRIASVALAPALLILLVAPICAPPAPPPAPTPDNVRTIEDLVACVNGRLAGSQNATIADTVQCLPPKCSITLTMSNQSAQAACILEGDGIRCQMPRVLIECPGPPKLIPSYLLCPQDSESEGVIGRNRIEIGQGVDAAGNMRMADVPIPPGPFTPIEEGDTISETTGQGDSGTKGCNGGGCHDAQAPLGSAPSEQLSQPIDPFGESPGNPDCIISTDRCDKSAIDEPKQCFPSTEDSRVVKPQSLSEVCDCIEAAKNDDLHPLAGDEITLALCRALEDYQDTRGACVSGGCPPATGPECSEAFAPCDPATGVTVASSGYHCQPAEGEAFECVADCPCRDYSMTGGGKFLVDSAVSMVRLQLSGHAATANPDSLRDSVHVTGELSGFEYASRTLLDSIAFSSFQATRTGGGFTASGKGTANVNGAPRNIEFTATTTGGVTTFEVSDADTSEVLLGGTGEDQRAAFDLSVTPP